MTVLPHHDPALARDHSPEETVADRVSREAVEALANETRGEPEIDKVADRLGADVLLARAGMSDHEYGRVLRTSGFSLVEAAREASQQNRDLTEIQKGWYSIDADGPPSTPERVADLCKRADNAWPEKAGCSAKRGYDVLAAARKYEALERTLRAKSHAQVWARDNNRRDDAARLGADIDRLYTQIGVAREEFLREVASAAPDRACPACGSNTATAKEDDGPQDVEPHLRSPGKTWMVRGCVECEHSERV